jgi:hypothetical protein
MTNTKTPTAPLTGAALKEQLLADIARNEAALKRHNDIISALTPHDNKTITKRLDKHLALIGGRIAHRFGMIYVEFPSVRNSDGGNGVTHLLAYNTVPVVDMDKFHNYYDVCNGTAAVERTTACLAALERCESGVTDLNLFLDAIDAFAKALKAMDAEAREINDAAKKAAYEKLGWYIR